MIKMILKRIDHANIFLLIAGTYTPMAFSALERDKGIMLLITVWTVGSSESFSGSFGSMLRAGYMFLFIWQWDG